MRAEGLCEHAAVLLDFEREQLLQLGRRRIGASVLPRATRWPLTEGVTDAVHRAPPYPRLGQVWEL